MFIHISWILSLLVKDINSFYLLFHFFPHRVLVFLWLTRSRSYQTFIFLVFRFLLLSLKVCSIWKKCVFGTMAKLSSKKRKNSLFTKKKSLVGLAPERVTKWMKSFVNNFHRSVFLRIKLDWLSFSKSRLITVYVISCIL